MECDRQPSVATPQPTDRGLTIRRPQKVNSAHPKDKKADEKEVITPEQTLTALKLLRRGMVLANRA
jgi:hypothetical protein